MVNITRVHQSPGNWASEISNLAPLGDYIYWLYARSFQLKPYYKLNVHTHEVSEAFIAPYPMTNWFYAKHLNKIIFPGQCYSEGWPTPDPCNPSSLGTVVMFENGVGSFHIIHPHTDNVNELTGACYHNGQWKVGERSGYIGGDEQSISDPSTSKYRRCAEYKAGGGIWVSNDGKVWSWSGFQDPMIPQLGDPVNEPWRVPYARECLLATLSGSLYAFMQGQMVADNVPTSIYRVNSNYSATHIADTPEPNKGLVPYPFNNNGFAWKGAIIMWCSYPALGVFSPALNPPLQFWEIRVNGQLVRNAGASPIGVYDGKLLIGAGIGDQYTVCQASELFGPVTQLADNWMPGSWTKGSVHKNKLWIGVMHVPPNDCAVDVFPIGTAPPEHVVTFNVRDSEGNPINNARVILE